jgi:dUTP pyrophosphatase
MILEYYLIRGKPPKRANPSDAGLDLYWNPDEDRKKAYLTNIVGKMLVQPGESIALQTGIKVAVPHGYMLEIKNRSSMAAKKSLLVGACVVDSGYEGEIFVNLHNVGKRCEVLPIGFRVAQAVLIPVVHFRPKAVTSEKELYEAYPITISNRGEGALGSTDVES